MTKSTRKFQVADRFIYQGEGEWLDLLTKQIVSEERVNDFEAMRADRRRSKLNVVHRAMIAAAFATVIIIAFFHSGNLPKTKDGWCSDRGFTIAVCNEARLMEFRR